jgi:hypothetical protein
MKPPPSTRAPARPRESLAEGASHVVMVSHPDVGAKMIADAVWAA